MSTITLTNQNHIETTLFQFGSCGISRVYLNGLQEGESIVFEDPYLIQNVNGIITGLDQRFIHMKHIRNDEVVATIDLSWTNSCETKPEPALIASSRTNNLPQTLGIDVIMIMLSLCFGFLMIKVRK